MKIEKLDLRGVEAPQPLLTVLSKVSSAPRDSGLEVMLDQQPFQLYDLLQQRGWRADFAKQEDGSVRLQTVPKSESQPH
jgi:hypothetical protein